MPLFRFLRATVGAVAATLLAATTVFLAVPSGAAPDPLPITLMPSGLAVVQVGTWSVDGLLSTPCDSAPTVADFDIAIGGVPAPTVAVTVVDADSFTLTVPAGLLPTSLSGVPLTVDLTCPVATTPTEFHGDSVYAEIQITKKVTGDAPVDAVFTVTVTCVGMFDSMTGSDAGATGNGVDPAVDGLAPVTFTLAADQSESVFVHPPIDTCTIVETDARGAMSTAYAPGSTIAIDLPVRTPVTITNTFPVTPPKFTG